ncbi:hypothetical protein CPB86DRAFT_818361 [Serendipita vermifera]|nr:hypothetical protein CPB86DRAFT_818361 [Serendipita vermifera]
MANLRPYITTLCLLIITLLILALGAVERPKMTQDIVYVTKSAIQLVTSKAEINFSVILSRDIDFAGPGGYGIYGVQDDSLHAGSLTSVISGAAAYAEPTASSHKAKQASSLASTASTRSSPSGTHKPEIASQVTETVNSEPKHTECLISSSAANEMPAPVITVQAVAQKLEQMVSNSVTNTITTSTNSIESVPESHFKAVSHTLQAPWHTSSSSSDSILFRRDVQILFVALLFVTTFLLAGIVFLFRFWYKRYTRSRAEAAARAAIADDEFFPKDIGLYWKEPIKQISDYKRSTTPVGLEWQIKAMRKAVANREHKIAIFGQHQNLTDTITYNYTRRQSTRSRLASFKRRQDRICSVPEYYFPASPAEAKIEIEVEPSSRKSLDSSMEKETQMVDPCFDRGDLAGQTTPGSSLYRPIKPSRPRYGFI